MSYVDEIRTDSHDNGIQPEKCLCVTHSLSLVDSVDRSNKSYYSQKLSEKDRYMTNYKFIKRYITEDLFDLDSDFDFDSTFNSDHEAI